MFTRVVYLLYSRFSFAKIANELSNLEQNREICCHWKDAIWKMFRPVKRVNRRSARVIERRQQREGNKIVIRMWRVTLGDCLKSKGRR